MILATARSVALAESYHDFFVAAASVAGALIGLLFVALSVARERELTPGETTLHELRAAAAFTAFSNALVVSLFALIPGQSLGPVETSVSIVGLSAMLRAFLVLARLQRAHQRARRWDGGFVIAMTLWFIGELFVGVLLDFGHGHRDTLHDWIAIFVIVFFVTGIARAWQLIGGPEFSLREEASKLAEERSHEGQAPDPPADSPAR